MTTQALTLARSISANLPHHDCGCIPCHGLRKRFDELIAHLEKAAPDKLIQIIDDAVNNHGDTTLPAWAWGAMLATANFLGVSVKEGTRETAWEPDLFLARERIRSALVSQTLQYREYLHEALTALTAPSPPTPLEVAEKQLDLAVGFISAVFEQRVHGEVTRAAMDTLRDIARIKVGA